MPGARYLPVPRAVVVGETPAPERGRGVIAVVSAGTSDVPVAEEAALTAELAATGSSASTTSAWPGCTG